MKKVLNLYTGVGKQVRASMNSHAPFLFEGPKPPTWQTPGRLQYYRAENEIFLPGKSTFIRSFLTPYLTDYSRDQVENSDAQLDGHA